MGTQEEPAKIASSWAQKTEAQQRPKIIGAVQVKTSTDKQPATHSTPGRRNKMEYGMRTRGAAPGAQPKDFKEIKEDPTGRYYDILVYDRELTQEETDQYDLEPITDNETEKAQETIRAIFKEWATKERKRIQAEPNMNQCDKDRHISARSNTEMLLECGARDENGWLVMTQYNTSLIEAAMNHTLATWKTGVDISIEDEDLCEDGPTNATVGIAAMGYGDEDWTRMRLEAIQEAARLQHAWNTAKIKRVYR